MRRLVIGFFGVLIALWTLLCLGLFAAFGIGTGMMQVIADLVFGANPEGAIGLLTAAGGALAFVIWLIGTTALVVVGWMMARASRDGVVVYTTTTGGSRHQWGERPMKDVTPPPDGRRDPGSDLPPR